MLEITVDATEVFDEVKEEFIDIKPQTLLLEHSLISLAKWESKWKKPFLSDQDKTHEELLDYVRCMTTNARVDDNIYYGITGEQFDRITEYIDDPMTATWFNDHGKKSTPKKSVITAELLYYAMIACQIPFECQKWHLNRLITLIRVCEIKNEPPKKMGKNEIMRRNRALNAARRARYNTPG